MKLIIIILSIIVILGILGIYYKIQYNRLINNKIKLEEAESIINTHLKNRFDYVIRVSHLVKKNLNLDIETFKNIESIKTKKISNIELDKKINEAYNVTLKLKEDYPRLNNNRGFNDIIADFNESNEIMEATKTFYDKYAAFLNELLSTFPTNIIGKIHRIKKSSYYKTTMNNEIDN